MVQPAPSLFFQCTVKRKTCCQECIDYSTVPVIEAGIERFSGLFRCFEYGATGQLVGCPGPGWNSPGALTIDLL